MRDLVFGCSVVPPFLSWFLLAYCYSSLTAVAKAVSCITEPISIAKVVKFVGVSNKLYSMGRAVDSRNTASTDTTVSII